MPQTDTFEMIMVHRVFRRELGNVPGLIKSVAPGDTTRATFLSNSLGDVLAGLHHHHQGEDDLLWPKLHERASMSDVIITRMENQHHGIAESLAAVEDLVPAWRASADPAAGEALAAAVETLSARVDEHLDDEELHVLPLVRDHITPEEWHELNERGAAFLPKNSKALVFLGFILQDATPDERRRFLADLPLPARLMWRVAGPRTFGRHHAKLYATG